MKLLLHICCAPCACYPVPRLRRQGFTVEGYFYNPNIHPWLEFKRRLDTLKKFAQVENLPIIYDETPHFQDYLRAVAFHEEERCRICYLMRLSQAAQTARRESCDAFSSTLLYSRYQQHDLIKQIAEAVAQEYNIEFYYEDFREGWQSGVDRSRALELYRQPYCGCIYSEAERYGPKKARHGSTGEDQARD